MSYVSGGVYVLEGDSYDSLWYDEIVTRQAGQCIVFTPTITDATTTIEFGFDTDKTGALAAQAIRMASDLLKPYDGGSAGPSIYVPLDSGSYSLAIALLTAGAQHFLDGKLLYKGGTNATSSLYVGLANTNATGTVGSIKASKTLWAATPTLADSFTPVTTLEDSGTNGFDGTISGAAGLGGPLVGATFNGVDSVVDFNSVAASAAFDGAEGTIITGVKVNNWASGNYEQFVRVYSDFNNNVSVRKEATTGNIALTYRAGGTYETITSTGNTTTDNFTVSASWSASGDSVECCVSGVSAGTSGTLGTWASAASFGAMKLGNDGGTYFLDGNLFDTVIGFGYAITEAQSLTLHGHIVAGTLTTTILDGIFGAGNYMWLPMDETYTSDGGGLTGIEAGGDAVEWTATTWANTASGAVNTPTLGAVENSGNLVVGTWYEIVTSQVDHFYTGSAATDTFRAAATTALDANNTVQAITLATLFRSTSALASPHAYISADWTIGAATQAGAFACLDSATTPANFIIAYHDGTKVYVEKCVAGTYTQLAAVTATYSADAPLILRTLPNGANIDWWCIYNDAYIASGTVTDAGIIDNTIHGLFSTSSDNVASNVEIFAATGHSIPGAA